MDLNIFRKLKEIYEGIRRVAWMLFPAIGLFFFLRWLFMTWLPARAKQWIAWLLEQIPETTVDPAAIGLGWDRVNQFVPLNETLALGAVYVGLAGMVVVMRFVRSLLPGG